MSFDTIGVVADSFRLAGRNLLKIAGYQLIAFGITACAAVAFMDTTSNGLNVEALGILPVVLAYTLFFVAILACHVITTEDAIGGKAGFFEGLRRAATMAPLTLLLMILIGVCFSAAILGPIIATSVLGPLGIVGLIFGGVIAIWFSCAIFPILPVLAVEQAGLGAVQRSLQLTAGYRLQIFLSSIVFAIVMVVASLIGQFAISAGTVLLLSAGGEIAAFAFAALASITLVLFSSALGIALQATVYAQLCALQD